MYRDEATLGNCYLLLLQFNHVNLRTNFPHLELMQLWGAHNEYISGDVVVPLEKCYLGDPQRRYRNGSHLSQYRPVLCNNLQNLLPPHLILA